MRVSVIGGSSIPPETAAVAEELGAELADRGHTVVCGGLGGVMEAVCRGAREADEDDEDGDEDSSIETIGILPTDRREDANPYVTIPIATGLGHARNALVVMNGDAAVAVNGGPGTLSEIGLALAHGRAVAGIDTHDVEGVEAAGSPSKAVDYVEGAVGDEKYAGNGM
ncbi:MULTISPECIES: LOG family protein [Haloferacaceae]|uniref:LOG family protein n=1 Tax=Halorubrum glutamatedens TaxID=2707018 RepID=A0ABD5QSB8_9EURY|nr:LOG family protein [Halobellus captivus]